jgi:hypothetical protein
MCSTDILKLESLAQAFQQLGSVEIISFSLQLPTSLSSYSVFLTAMLLVFPPNLNVTGHNVALFLPEKNP